MNDAPVNTVPATQTVVEDIQTTISGISISDVDAASNSLTTRLQVLNGTVNVSLAGLASISAGVNGSADLTIQGTVADINATLASLSYTGNADIEGINADTLTVTTDDLGYSGSGGAQSDVDTIQIDITGINDDPGATGLVTDIIVTEDVLSNVDLSAVNFFDVDAGTGLTTVTLSTSTGGELTLAADANLTFGGIATARTITGSLADLNTYFNLSLIHI